MRRTCVTSNVTVAMFDTVTPGWRMRGQLTSWPQAGASVAGGESPQQLQHSQQLQHDHSSMFDVSVDIYQVRHVACLKL